MFPRILEYSRLIFLLSVVLYSVIAAYYFFHLPIGFGDESLFISDLDFIKSHGWIDAIRKNVSIPYMILAYPFSLFLENYISLRLVNVMLLVGMLAYFYYSNNNKRLTFYGYVFFLHQLDQFFLFRNQRHSFCCFINNFYQWGLSLN